MVWHFLFMDKIAISTTVAVLLLASTFNLSGASLKGVTLPDTVQVGGATLMLNGLGLRTKFSVKVYVIGLYVEQRSSDPTAIIRADAPKRVVMHFVHTASKNQMVEALDEAISDNTPEAKKTMKPDIDQLLGALDSIKEGDLMVFTYVPGTGTILTINGKEKLTIAGPGFGQVVFSMWLGPKPPNAGLKKGILGQ
jgi:hypothetical protein